MSLFGLLSEPAFDSFCGSMPKRDLFLDRTGSEAARKGPQGFFRAAFWDPEIPERWFCHFCSKQGAESREKCHDSVVTRVRTAFDVLTKSQI